MIKIFADTSDLNEIAGLDKNPLIAGFTTNPTLMRKAGVTDYQRFCQEVLGVTSKPVSFEVFADEFREMERQAQIISGWGSNVYVKIPITNTKGESMVVLINRLSQSQIKVNATAVTTRGQYKDIVPVASMIISIFAGRVADTGQDPQILFGDNLSGAEFLWASPREVLNIYQAEEAGADIITCTPDLIAKYEKLKGKDLLEYSLETVQMFYNDAKVAGFQL